MIIFTVFILYKALKSDIRHLEENPVKHYRGLIISLPEEIDQAEEGDLLQVERVTNDTIFLGYKQY